MSGDRTTPRFDVVATTRRRWSKAQKKAIVAEVDVGGATLSEVARRHGIHASLLFRWRKTLGSVMGSAPIDTGTAMTAPATPRFVPVMLPPPAPPIPTTSQPARPGLIEIVFDGRCTVRVGADVDTGALLRIIDALEKPR
jgi:transposase